MGRQRQKGELFGRSMENLTIVIPFWNGHKTVNRLLDSLPDNANAIVVNDHGSAAPHINRRNTKVINLEKRGYFSGACNVGFFECDTDVLVLNQDVHFFGSHWLDGVRMAQHAGLGVYGDGVMGHPAWPMGYVQGTFMYLSRAALDKVGGFNEDLYPLWGATAEWQLRVCRAGFKVLPVAEIEGMQHEERSRYGSAIERALLDEPDKRSSFINTPPEVSVIVPCYNYGIYLEECIESLMTQTMQSFEVIIVDDCSTDGSEGIAQGLQDYYKGIRVLRHKKNHGTAATINTGIRSSYGKFITILSADDRLASYSVERHWRFNKENPHSFTYGNIMFCTDGEMTEVKMQEFDFQKLLYKNHVPAGIMYPRSAWGDVGGYPEIMADGREDWAFAVGLGRACYCGVHIGQTGYLVRREKQNRSLRNRFYGKNYFLNKIMSIYPDVYRNGGKDMACCGKRGSATRPVTTASSATAIQPKEGFTLLTYIGKSIGTAVLWCPSGRKYKYGRTARRVNVAVRNDDLAFMMDTGFFKYATISKAVTSAPKKTEEVINEDNAQVIDLSDGVSKEEASLAGKTLSEYARDDFADVNATDTAKDLAFENEVELSEVTGTGKDGRITKADVQKYIDAR